MRTFKIYVIAAITAMALMAYMGAGSASATKLYSGATALGAGTEILATSEGSSLFTDTSASTIVTCGGIGLGAGVGNAGSSTTTVSGAAGLGFGGCTSTTTAVENGSFEIHHIAGTKNGTLTASGFIVTIHVFGVECSYTAGAGTDLGTVTGSTTTNATIDINAIVSKKAGGFLCPSTARWLTSLIVTSPSPLHVTAS